MPELTIKGAHSQEHAAERLVGSMRVMGRDGDSRIIWDPGSADEVEAAKGQFDSLTGRGYQAWRVSGGGGKGEQIREFDPTAEKLILAPPLAGGSGVHELLVDARNLLARGGVAQSRFSRPDGSHCARGAILRCAGVPFYGDTPAHFERGVAREAARALAQANGLGGDGLNGGYGGPSIAGWSNALVADGRPEEVLAGFDRAIALTAPAPVLPDLSIDELTPVA